MEIVKVYENEDIRDVFLIEKKNGIDIFFKDEKIFSGIIEIYRENNILGL